MSGKPRDFDGSHWDTRRLRRVREAGWFRQHEAELIREAMRRRPRLSAAAADAQRREGRYRCPKCGNDSAHLQSREGLAVGECPACGWILVDRADIERLIADLVEPAQPPEGGASRSADDGTRPTTGL